MYLSCHFQIIVSSFHSGSCSLCWSIVLCIKKQEYFIALWLQEQVNKLQRRLAEADAAEEARKKSLQEAAKEEVEEENVVAPIQEGQGQVINAWVCRYLLIAEYLLTSEYPTSM